MKTPSSDVLRKALKLVEEIEKIDQQIYDLLETAKNEKQVVSKKKIKANEVSHHEQQTLLMDDTSVETLSAVELQTPDIKEESSEQSCCLF